MVDQINNPVMTPLEFVKHLHERCEFALDRSGFHNSPAGNMAQGRNQGLMEMSAYIGKYLKENANG